MSANVWTTEVALGLINEIKNTVTIKDMHGISVPLPDECIIVRKPENDFNIENLPCVSIYNTDYAHDPFRYTPEPVVVSTNKEQRMKVMEESAVPFNLNYQIDFWSDYQDDMDSMTMTWLVKHFRQFNLDVIDTGGVKRSCNCIMTTAPKRADLVLRGERLFRTIISYSIWVELDNETRYNVNIVDKVNINSHVTITNK